MTRLWHELIKLARTRLTFKHMGQYVSAVYLSQGIVAIRSFINARWLGPQDYGFWGWLAFIVSFGYHLHLGVQEMMIKEIPALQAKNRLAEAKRLAQITFSFYFLMLVIGAGLLGVVSFTLPPSTSPTHRLGWIVVGFAMIFEVLFYFEQVVARSMGYLGKLGSILLMTNSFSLVLTCLLVIRYGIIGIYCVAILTPLFGFISLHRFTQYPLKFIWASKKLKDKIRSGWPIVAMGLSFLAINWVDRSMIIHYLGIKAHGYYTLGATLSFLVFLFPKGLADILEPKLHFSHSSETTETSINKHFLMPLLIFAWLMPLCLLAGHILLPWILRWVLVDYLPGLMVIRILIWTSYFVGLITLTKSSVVALGRQNHTVPAYLCAILINGFVSLWMVKHGYGAAGISVGSACAFGIISIWLIGLVLAKLKQSRKTTLQYLFEIYLPYALLGLPNLVYAWLANTRDHSQSTWLLGLPIAGFIAYVCAGLYRLIHRVNKFSMSLTPEIINQSVEVLS